MLHPSQIVLAGFLFQLGLFGQTPSSTTITTSANPSNYGKSVTLTATVTAGASGKVTFYDGTTVLGVGALSGTQANLTTVMLSSGNRKLRAYYNGDGTFAASSSPTLSQTVAAVSSLGFHKFINYPNSNAPGTIAVGDFNGDGAQDLVMTSGISTSVTMHLGNGDGTFQTGMDYAVGYVPNSVVIGDFNGDGRPDLAVTNLAGNTVSILMGNGDGTFPPAVSYATTNNPKFVAIADLNGDGIADLAVLGYSSMAIHIGKGDGTFKAAAFIATGTNPRSVAVADFNSDGRADLVVATSGLVDILLGNGDGTFQAAQSVFSGSSFAWSAATADFNGDGLADLLVNATSDLEVLLGKGDGTFGTAVVYPLGAASSITLIGDFSGDGNTDIAVISYSGSVNGVAGNYVAVLPGNGDGTFGTASYFPITQYFNAGAFGDFNGDGRSDLAVGSNNLDSGYSIALGGAAPDLTIVGTHDRGFTQGQLGATYTLTVTNAGDFPSGGPVGAIVTLPAGLTATGISGGGWTCLQVTLACTRNDSLAAGASFSAITLKVNVAGSLTGDVISAFTVSGGGELNTANDYTLDIALVRSATTTTLTSSPNQSALGQAVTLTATVTAGATGRVAYYAGTTPLGSAILTGGQSVFTVSLLPSGVNSLRAIYPGDSNFGPSASQSLAQTVNPVAANGVQPYTSYKVDSQPSVIAAGDFNSDGKTDFVTANGNDGTISILLGNGDGTFRPPVGFRAGITGQIATLAADFNNDGKPDLAVTNGSSLAIFPGNGDGTFGAAQVVSSANFSGSISAADFDGDGNTDLMLVVNDTVVLYPGNGNGTFRPRAAITPLGSSYSYLAVADMNGDGRPDFVVLANASYSSSTVEVFLGNGDGTFQSPANRPLTNTNVSALMVGDYNGDGRPDVVFFGPAMNVLVGNGDGTLQAPLLSNLGATTTFATTGDFNGDGKLDVACGTFYGLFFAFGNGDGTFRAGPTIPINGAGNAIATGDFNGDGRTDFSISDPASNTVDVYLGGQVSGLNISLTHTGRFVAGQTEEYGITIQNPAFAGTSTVVIVRTHSLRASPRQI